jgi:hypothetical protein
MRAADYTKLTAEARYAAVRRSRQTDEEVASADLLMAQQSRLLMSVNQCD